MFNIWTKAQAQVIMAIGLKSAVILLMLTLFFVISKYYKAKGAKENCYLNLDKHIKHIKENERQSKLSKETFEKLVHSKESQVDDLKKQLVSGASSLQSCESLSAKMEKEIR